MSEENTGSAETPKKKWRKSFTIILVILVAIVGLRFTGIKKLFTSEDNHLQCGMSQSQLYEHYKNSVVLVANSYVYEVRVKGSEPILFTKSDYYFEPYQKGKNEPITISGTGFFVSKDGKIVTNRHVASPWTTETNDMATLREAVASILPASIDAKDAPWKLRSGWDERMNEEIGEDEDEGGSAEVTAETDSLTTASTDSTEISTEAEAEAVVPEQKEGMLDPDDVVITGRSVWLGIALHNARVNDMGDFIPCQVLTVSEEEAIDVAIVQTKSEELPYAVKNVVELSGAVVDEDEIVPGSKAIMIGYPMGMQLAGTSRGIKVQVYDGEVNKESDGVNLQYNITSTHGASGSPVFDDCGRLIAVNYAGYDETQGFNFGIVASHIVELSND